MMATETPANVIKDSTIMAKLERSARPPEGSSLWDRFLWDWKGKRELLLNQILCA